MLLLCQEGINKVCSRKRVGRSSKSFNFSQPTRGVDIGAQALIWQKLRESRDKGLAVLLVSADLEELIGLSDRILVIYQGKFVANLNPEDITPEDLGAYMTGLKK